MPSLKQYGAKFGSSTNCCSKKIRFLVLISLFQFGYAANAKVDVSDMGFQRSSVKTETVIDDALRFRQLRRVGVGVVAAGPYGLFGTQLDFNFTNQTSFNIGVGGSSEFQSIVTEIREYMDGIWFQPFFAIGYAQWARFSGGAAISRTTPSFLYDKFLTETEKQSGKFAKNLIFPSLGIQYFQLNGKMAGWTMFAELTLLSDVGDFQFVPTAAVGTSYCF